MRAWCAIRKGPLYRHEAFVEGLKRIGCELHEGYPAMCAGDCNLLVIWNRYDASHQAACAVEKAGGVVLVAENGYLGPGGSSPKFDVVDGRVEALYFALARGGHNGQGIWPHEGAERFEQLGVPLKPWRTTGEYVLVCANRSFGIPGRMMPIEWPQRVVERLRGETNLPVRLRSHPGNGKPTRPLEEDLAGARAVVVWSSSAGAHALAAGIPVVCEAPYWILKGAACATLAQALRGELPERRTHFWRMAWAQWTLAEIASGEPFRRLLGTR